MTKLSALASQLRSIQQEDHNIGGVSTVGHSYVASFLFDEREATDIDNAAILALGKSGLEELRQLDPVFAKFELVLFGENTLETHRSMLTKTQNDSLDESLRVFLRLLSPHFLSKPAHKCLEWLIRRYRVNELNIDAVMDCILPYHETTQFVRMVQILYFGDNSRWGFLHDVKREARVVSRSFLAKRMLADRALLDGVFACVEWMVVRHRDTGSRKPATYLSFFAMVVVDYIMALPQVELRHVLHLFPIALRLVKVKGVSECALTSYMLILALAQRYPVLSSESVAEYISFASRVCPETLVPQLMLTVARLVDVCHLTVTEIAPAAFTLLSRLPGFAAVSHDIIGKYRLPHFSRVLAASFAAQQTSRSEMMETMSK